MQLLTFISRSSFSKVSSLTNVCYSTSTSYQKIVKILKEMPKEPKHVSDLQRQRAKIRERNAKYAPGTVNLQFLCPSTTGPASVYLFTDQSRYLFNCGEGTQRLAHEHKTKLARLEHIFMTRTSWGNIGGLPGLCLTVQDAGVPELTLHGPPGLDEIFQATRRFVVLRDLKVSAVEAISSDEGYEDTVMSVKYVPIFRKGWDLEKQEEELIPVDSEDYYAHESNMKPKFVMKNFMEKLLHRNEHCVTAYVCKLKPRPGTLDLEKCVEKGVPPGPLLGQLKNGIDIVLPDGTKVLSSEVRGPDDPGPKFIFIDVPNEDYFESFLENQEKLADNSNDSESTSVIVHFSSENVISSPLYQEFLGKFSDKTTHFLANGNHGFSGHLAAHRIQWQLNQLEPNIFPILNEASKYSIEENCGSLKKKLKSDPASEDSSPSKENNSDSDNNNKIFTTVSTQTSYHLRPLKGLDRTTEPVISPNEFLNELEIIPDCLTSIQALKEDLKGNLPVETRTKSYPKIVFLGTGSCIPNKTRNVSSILLQSAENGYLLLDCGEGTAAQIYRYYGKEKGDEIMKNLQGIYVSHLHADHHLGLIGILRERKRLFENASKELLLFAPKQISFWLSFYDKRIESIQSDYRLIPNGDLIETSFTDETLKESGILSIKTCLVKHCPHAFGVAVETVPSKSNQKPVKITYSGDTTPCQDLITLGENSTILIHEATMEDDLEDEAKYKMHSTISQAIQQGTRMNAEYTILTHFSQRYAKIPRIESNALQENIGLAFDNMEVTIDDLPKLHKFYPSLKIMFMEHCDEMDQKALKRELKKQRQRSRNASPVPQK